MYKDLILILLHQAQEEIKIKSTCTILEYKLESNTFWMSYFSVDYLKLFQWQFLQNSKLTISGPDRTPLLKIFQKMFTKINICNFVPDLTNEEINEIFGDQI